MESIFLYLLNMSITASWIALAVIVLRLFLEKAPCWITCILWGFVAIRLVCPFTFESIFSLIPSVQTVPQDIASSASPSINSGLGFIDNGINGFLGDNYYEGVTVPAGMTENILRIAAVIWLAGVAVALIYTVISALRIRARVKEAVIYSDGIFSCDRVVTPFIFGIVHPKIYLPSSINENETDYVLSHETAHIKRKDYIWKPLGFMLLSVYWFNPVIWLSYALMCRDIEKAADERVIKEKGSEIKKPYAEALINCSVPHRMISACPLAFGGGAVRDRVKSVLNYRKPSFWMIIAAVIVCVATAVCLLTNPVGTKIDNSLSVFLDNEILSHHRNSGVTEDPFVCVDYKIIGRKKSGSETTLYMWVLYNEYSFDGEIHLDSGSYTPTLISVRKIPAADGLGYELTEYWEPGFGSQFGEDIRAKFPLYLHSRALDSQRYIEEQEARCLKSAAEYYGQPDTVTLHTDIPPDTTVAIPVQ